MMQRVDLSLQLANERQASGADKTKKYSNRARTPLSLPRNPGRAQLLPRHTTTTFALRWCLASASLPRSCKRRGARLRSFALHNRLSSLTPEQLNWQLALCSTRWRRRWQILSSRCRGRASGEGGHPPIRARVVGGWQLYYRAGAGAHGAHLSPASSRDAGRSVQKDRTKKTARLWS